MGSPVSLRGKLLKIDGKEEKSKAMEYEYSKSGNYSESTRLDAGRMAAEQLGHDRG